MMDETDTGKGGGPGPVPGGKPPREGWSLAFLTAMLCAGLLAFFLFDPASSGGFWVCPFHRITGWYCPGCGGQRALHELLHGHFAAALRLNPFAVLVFLPLAGAAFAAYALRVLGVIRPRPFALRNWQVILLLAAMLLFGVLRNVWGPPL
jgi:hypothetical protein